MRTTTILLFKNLNFSEISAGSARDVLALDCHPRTFSSGIQSFAQIKYGFPIRNVSGSTVLLPLHPTDVALFRLFQLFDNRSFLRHQDDLDPPVLGTPFDGFVAGDRFERSETDR